MNQLLFIISLIIVVSIWIVPASTRFRAPILLVFLALGMFLGEDGPVGIQFADYQLTYQVGSVCLALILLSGGLDTDWKDVRAALLPASLLAGPGVILTALIIGIAYALLLQTSLLEGLLFGAVVGSTDAAATFMSLKHGGIALREKSRQTLLVESGVNDPMAIFLTIGFLQFVDGDGTLSASGIASLLPDLAMQFGIGLAAGAAGGFANAWLMDRFRLPAGLGSPLILASGLLVYSGTDMAGGSGFLAVYVFGLATANARSSIPMRARHFHEALAWVAQICLFVLLGLLVTPSALVHVALPGLALAAILFLFARPLAVALCLTPLRTPLREQGFIAWMGMRGSVPIFLAIIPVVSPGPITPAFFNLVFVIVVLSLLVHGWSASGMARLMGVADAPEEEPTKAPPTAA